MPTLLPVSPAIATIDQNNFLVVNWNPPVFQGGYAQYKDWNIWLSNTPPFTPPGVLQLVNGHKPTGLEFAGSTLDSRIFQEQLISADYGMNMQAEPVDNINFSNSPLWNGSPVLLLFPTRILPTDVTLDNTTLELGQTVTVTLANTYPSGGLGSAQYWQVNWPDNTNTGPLPLSNRSAAKSFSTPGAFDVQVVTWNDYSGFTPPVKLYRSLDIPILVVNQQFNPGSGSSGNLTSTLGFGGTTQFEIVGASGTASTPQPYSVIARCLVRDTQTNELKALVLTSRFSNASSELGSMALDVFPLQGRPKAKELIVPTDIITVTANTTPIPVSILTATLPNVIVGKAMAQFKLQASGGIDPYGWYNDGTLPPGLQLSVDGTITGTPTQLGIFSVNLAVIDSGSPAYIAEVTLPMTVATDLVITTATIPNAQVLTPYTQQLASAGGLAPYTWEVAAGAFPIGIFIDPNTGLLFGTPCTYNSTTDFSTQFTATVQITDAIGAIATKTYTISLSPAALQFGPVDQARIFAQQDFVLTVPVFGGHSPYVFNPSDFVTGDSYIQTPVAFSDGRVEIRAGNQPSLTIPNSAVGVHNLTFLQGAITDSQSVLSPLTSLTYAVGQQISDFRLQDAFFNHYWKNTVNVTDVQVVSNVLTVTANNVYKAGDQVIFNGLGAATFLNAQNLALTSVAAAVAGSTVYTGTGLALTVNALAGFKIRFSGFTQPLNNGTFTVASNTNNTITVNNPNGAVDTSGSAVTPIVTIATVIGGGPVFTGFTASYTHANYGPTVETVGTALDITEVIIQTKGSLAGFGLNPVVIAPPPLNGIDAIIDTSTTPAQAEAIGQAVLFQNSETRFPLQILSGVTQVATISRPYTLLAHDDGIAPGDVGTVASFAHVYVVNDFVALNPRKPYWNSPSPDSIPSFSPSPTNVTLTAQIAAASALPTGLSLDANTGLIYGILLAPFSGTSVIQYLDSSNLIHGTITITWNTIASAFTLVAQGGLDDLQTGTFYPPSGLGSLNPFTSTGVTITGVSVYNSSANPLPAGLAVSTDGTNIIVSGTPTEAGYFDVWFAATSANNGTAYAHARMSVDYIIPLVILNTSMPTISDANYNVQMQGFGGITPYVWGASDSVNGTWLTSGVNLIAPTTGQFVGLQLNTQTGVLSGQLAPAPASGPPRNLTSPTDLGNITFSLTDSRVPTPVTVTSALDVTYNNNLRILTPSTLGVAQVTSDTDHFSFKMEATGGIPPYFWQMNNVALPGGITFTATAPTAPALETTTPPGGGWFEGTWSGVPFSGSVAITVTDSTTPTALTATENFTINTESAFNFTINTSGVGQIARGEPYQGTLVAQGTFTTPVRWQIAPTTTQPNLLPSGLSLSFSGTGATAQIAGTYTGSALVNFPVRVIAVDAAQNTAETVLLLNTVVHSVTVTTTSLPNAVITVSYNVQLTATGGVPFAGGLYNWAVSPPLPPGLSLATTGPTAGTISGAATTLFNSVFNFTATDSIGNTSVATPLNFASQAAGLTITTTQSNLNANQPLSGRAYSFQFAAAGDANTPYTWSISPSSPNQLPAGLALSTDPGGASQTAHVTGTTTATGFSKNVIIRVTDNIGAYTEGTFLFTVTQALTLQTGIDFEDSTSTDFLGYADNGSVGGITTRPNQSFVVVATGVIATTAGALTVGTSDAGITATAQTPGTVNGVVVPGAAAIILSGAGFNKSTGTYSLTVTLTDSGVTVSKTFTWTVYDHGTSLVVAPVSGTLPLQQVG